MHHPDQPETSQNDCWEVLLEPTKVWKMFVSKYASSALIRFIGTQDKSGRCLTKCVRRLPHTFFIETKPVKKERSDSKVIGESRICDGMMTMKMTKMTKITTMTTICTTYIAMSSFAKSLVRSAGRSGS